MLRLDVILTSPFYRPVQVNPKWALPGQNSTEMNHTALNRENTLLLQKKIAEKKMDRIFYLLFVTYLVNFENSLKIWSFSKI